MTTTELIKLLHSNEHGGVTGRSREISFYINGKHFINEPKITIAGSGDGLFTTLELNLITDRDFKAQEYTYWSNYEKGVFCIECGHDFDNIEFARFAKFFKHCPNCGRKIRMQVEAVKLEED